MTPGGVTELIWHFAGYIHAASEYVKGQTIYQDGALRLRQQDYTIDLDEAPFRWDLAAFDSDPVPNATFDFADQHTHPALHALQARISPVVSEPMRAPPLPKEKLKPPPSDGGGGGDKMISVTYRDAGDEMLAEIVQRNRLSDDDRALTGTDDAIAPPDLNAAETLQAMLEAAESQTPGELAFPQQGTGAAVEFLSAHDAQVISGAGGDSAHSVAPGRYVNGAPAEADNAEPPAPPPAEPAEEAAPPEQGDGQSTQLGANTHSNTAVLVDLNGAVPSMIVVGDYVKTNAIVQTNSFVDNDAIEAAGGTALELATGDNTAENIAEFLQKAGVHAEALAESPGPHFSGWTWTVDVVEGDYLDIRLLVQENRISDNDIVVQNQFEGRFEIIGGDNEQYNLASISAGDFTYDLIVVEGGFHAANLIFQHNIIVDSDVVKMTAHAEHAPDQLALTGQNALKNDAYIANYGDDTFTKMTAEMRDLVDALEDREASLDSSLGMFPGFGPTFEVLYVEGDYFNINAVWQLNVVADIDVTVQVIAGSDGDAESVTQHASTGGNQLTNEASIVDLGSTSAFLGGEMYEDTILIQADLVADDEDEVIEHDTETLVTELIAFTDLPDAENHDDLPRTADPNFYGDPIASMLT